MRFQASYLAIMDFYYWFRVPHSYINVISILFQQCLNGYVKHFCNLVPHSFPDKALKTLVRSTEFQTLLLLAELKRVADYARKSHSVHTKVSAIHYTACGFYLTNQFTSPSAPSHHLCQNSIRRPPPACCIFWHEHVVRLCSKKDSYFIDFSSNSLLQSTSIYWILERTDTINIYPLNLRAWTDTIQP